MKGTVGVINGLKLPNYLTDEQIESIMTSVYEKKPIIISGIQGATGKTTLYNILKEQGVIVYEKWQCEEIILDKSLV